MKKNGIRTLAALLAGCMITGAGMPVMAAGTVDGSDYEANYTATIDIKDLLIPGLAATTDTTLIVRQIELAMSYGQLTEADVFEMRGEGANIPDAALRTLADQGFISGYIASFYAGTGYTAADFDDVFDAQWYYAQHPELAAAGIAYDENTVFTVFLNTGMNAGQQGNEEFNLTYFKANYPDLVAQLGDDNMAYYVYYIIYGDSLGLVADELL